MLPVFYPFTSVALAQREPGHGEDNYLARLLPLLLPLLRLEVLVSPFLPADLDFAAAALALLLSLAALARLGLVFGAGFAGFGIRRDARLLAQGAQRG